MADAKSLVVRLQSAGGPSLGLTKNSGSSQGGSKALGLAAIRLAIDGVDGVAPTPSTRHTGAPPLTPSRVFVNNIFVLAVDIATSCPPKYGPVLSLPPPTPRGVFWRMPLLGRKAAASGDPTGPARRPSCRSARVPRWPRADGAHVRHIRLFARVLREAAAAHRRSRPARRQQ